ncbi:hypothetical protein CK226_28385 [Mesorhizobium sp. WSM4311]|nr:hypothetical protein CK226_28385 [Mesorhizobium sp. WSM4311]
MRPRRQVKWNLVQSRCRGKQVVAEKRNHLRKLTGSQAKRAREPWIAASPEDYADIAGRERLQV